MTSKSRPLPWTSEEDRLIVEDYLVMLQLQIAGALVNKSKTRRALLPLLNNRSEGSIEFKRMNISAVLKDLGRPHLAGYQPASNYQNSLKETVQNLLTKFAL